jgi:signal transduction histidine kinase
MFFERVRAIVHTLRFRLMLWNACVVILTGFVVLISLREGVRYTLLYDMDQVLSEDLQEIRLSFQGKQKYNWLDLLDQLSRKARGHSFHGWFVQFFDRDGKLVWTSVNAPQDFDLNISQRSAGKASVDGYRVSFHALPHEVKQASAVCVGCSQAFVARDMGRIDRLALFCGGVVLLVSPLGGYLLALRATQPIGNLIQTTARLRPQELNERLPIRGTGDELDSLALTVNSLLDRIADYLQQKHDFLANAAHELRTPLAAIRSSVEVALGGDRTVEEYNELLAEVIDECSSLEALVNQLLLLAETDADRLRIHGDAVALDELVDKALEMFQGVAEFQGIHLRAGHFPPLRIAGNRHHLRQVLNNLLDNAIKFTAAKHCGDEESPIGANGDGTGGEIVVLMNHDRERNLAVLQIRDNGPGIPAESMTHIFERFYRVDRSRARDTNVGGTGLGLSICKAIISAHQGSISVQSEPGEGTTFTITLPLASVAVPSAVS